MYSAELEPLWANAEVGHRSFNVTAQGPIARRAERVLEELAIAVARITIDSEST